MLGATHPNLVRDQGEAYRESLMARVRELGVEDHVVFLDQFVDQATLLEFISMCDVYVTPYLNEAQMTSGTLAYSFGLGKAVVSTPYWHARELLADGRGVLVPFGDAAAIGSEIAELLTDDARRQAMRKRAYASSRSMTWERTAERYMSVFENARQGHWLKVDCARRARACRSRAALRPPEMQIDHFLSMCDDTGLFQHAVHSVPDRSHGYCVDDNARALLLACALNSPGEQRLSEVLTARFAAFVQHAWNPDTRRFRNFMSFDRSWLEDQRLRRQPRADACGRWASARAAMPVRRGGDGRPPCSPRRCRPWKAFARRAHGPSRLLGLDAYCAVAPDDHHAREIRHSLADRLMSALAAVETPDWIWFEEGLAYDNARLPQALIVTGMATQTPAYVDAGLRSLRWLMTLQTTPTGHFRPVGTAELRRTCDNLPRAFDQQPLEATATISACLRRGARMAMPNGKPSRPRVFAWFLGSNDLSVPLVDPETGSCRDGLHPDRANENRGGESVVSYLLGLAEIRQLARVNVSPTKPAALRAIGA